MTEQEWLECSEVWPMLAFLGCRDQGAVTRLFSWFGFRSVPTTTRKLRLFACACCRLNCKIMKVPQLAGALEVSERFADQLASSEELTNAADAVRRIFPSGETAMTFAGAC